MYDKSLSNIIKENFILSLGQSLRDKGSLVAICVIDCCPISRNSCEPIEIAHKNLNQFKFTGKQLPTIHVPIVIKEFDTKERLESAVCAISNHRMVDYALEIKNCNLTDVVDRLKPDFVFVDKKIKQKTLMLHQFCARNKIKMILV